MAHIEWLERYETLFLFSLFVLILWNRGGVDLKSLVSVVTNHVITLLAAIVVVDLYYVSLKTA